MYKTDFETLQNSCYPYLHNEGLVYSKKYKKWQNTAMHYLGCDHVILGVFPYLSIDTDKMQ